MLLDALKEPFTLFCVPEKKLRQYCTLKSDASKGKYKRPGPEYIVHKHIPENYEYQFEEVESAELPELPSSNAANFVDENEQEEEEKKEGEQDDDWKASQDEVATRAKELAAEQVDLASKKLEAMQIEEETSAIRAKEHVEAASAGKFRQPASFIDLTP